MSTRPGLARVIAGMAPGGTTLVAPDEPALAGVDIKAGTRVALGVRVVLGVRVGVIVRVAAGVRVGDRARVAASVGVRVADR